jgi:hypothetical protein
MHARGWPYGPPHLRQVAVQLEQLAGEAHAQLPQHSGRQQRMVELHAGARRQEHDHLAFAHAAPGAVRPGVQQRRQSDEPLLWVHLWRCSHMVAHIECSSTASTGGRRCVSSLPLMLDVAQTAKCRHGHRHAGWVLTSRKCCLSCFGSSNCVSVSSAPPSPALPPVTTSSRPSVVQLQTSIPQMNTVLGFGRVNNGHCPFTQILSHHTALPHHLKPTAMGSCRLSVASDPSFECNVAENRACIKGNMHS